jgi:fibronectin-binding autotransporter adhesin
LVKNADVDVSSGLTATIRTSITEDGTARSLTKNGAGTLVLSSGVVAYSGGTAVRDGTLRLDANDVFNGTAVTVAGNSAGVTATLDLAGHDDTVSSLTLGGSTPTSAAAVITGVGTLTLGGNVAYDGTNNPAGATISGKVNLGSATRTVTVGDSASAADDLTISAAISGTGVGLTKAGAGTLYLSGGNTYTGPTTLSAGALRTSAPAVLPGYDSPGNVVFNGGTLLVVLGGAWTLGDVDTVVTNATKTSGALALDTSSGDVTQPHAWNFGALGLTKLGANALTLDQANTYTGPTVVSAGVLRLANTGAIGSSSGLTLANGSTLELRSDTGATFNTPLTTVALGATATIDVNNNGSGTGNILALGGLSTTGSWTLNVTGDNGYILSIPTGTFSHATAAGNRTLNPTTANVRLGTVSLVLNGTSGDPKLVLGGTSNDNRIDSMTVSVASGGNRYNIEKNTAATWTINNFNGGGGIGNQFLLSAGDLIVTGSLNVAGMGNGLVMNGGTLHYDSPGAIQSDAGTRFRFNNASVKLDNTSGAAITTSTYNPQMAWYANWTFVGSNGANSNLYLGAGAVSMNATRQVTVQNAETTLTVGGIISGATYGLTKAGDGTLALSGANAYTGPTIVSAGTLLVNSPGSLNVASAVTVNTGGTLGGDGTINGAVTVNDGGTLAPGASAGTLTVNNSLAMGSGSTYVWQIGSGGLADLVDINGTLSIASSWTLKLMSDGGTPGTGEYNLFTYDAFSGSFTLPTIDPTGTWTTAKVAQDTVGKRIYLSFGLPGDTNGDFVVDAADFITLKKNFGAGVGGGVGMGNFDKTGTVDWADLGILMDKMGTTGGAPSTAPEPCSAMLLIFGAAALLRRRRS